MGRHLLRVEWTPGHSPGHVCLFAAQGGLLFAGDHILPELSPNIGLHPQSTPDPLHDYLGGLRRMAELAPREVLPAHGRPFSDIAGRVNALISHHRRRLDQIVQILGHEDKTGWRVALDLWGPRENMYEKRLALQEGLAHLQALAVEGLVSKSVTPGSVRWRRA
jgi:glyoxylase-like metal-dependent hydrolase (beta-lactamase superfamily II)